MVRLRVVVLLPVVQAVLRAVQAVLQPLVEVPILEVQEDQVEDTLQVEDVLRVAHGGQVEDVVHVAQGVLVEDVRRVIHEEQVEDVVHVVQGVPVEDVRHVVHGVPVEDVRHVVHEEDDVPVPVVAVVVEIRDRN